jgi:hypothetical protein
MTRQKIALVTGLIFASVHIALFAMTLIYTITSHDGQASLVWIFWVIADLPVGLLDLLPGKNFMLWLDSLSKTSPAAAYLLYPPYVVHGLIGTLWWYFIPRLLLPRSFGGIWGKRTA